MSKVKRAAGGGAIILMLATMGGVAFDKWMAYSERMASIEASLVRWEEFLAECQEKPSCGRAWKGSCIEKGQHCEEDV